MDQRSAPAAAAAAKARQGKAAGFAFPYDNSPEAFQSVLCTDGLNPARAAAWKGYAAKAQRTAPDFGPLWTWASAPCASSTWTARDEDAYRGGFSHDTASPVLVVGNYWDPATNYAGAVAAAGLLPNSTLLSSDSWGHTAYGTSPCVTRAVDRYLLSLALPDRGTRCVGDEQAPAWMEPDSETPSASRSILNRVASRRVSSTLTMARWITGQASRVLRPLPSSLTELGAAAPTSQRPRTRRRQC